MSWRVVSGLPALRAGKNQALQWRDARVEARWPLLPPLPQQLQHFLWQHDVAVFAAFGLHDPDDALRAVDIAGPEPRHFAGTKPAAISEREHDPQSEAAGSRHGEQPPGLLRAQGQRQVQRLFDVIDFRRQIVPPQRYPEQEPYPGHDAVAVMNAGPVLDQMQLEAAHIVRSRRVRRALEKGGEALASADMAPLRAFAELAGVHVLDHALAQRAYRICVIGNRPG